MLAQYNSFEDWPRPLVYRDLPALPDDFVAALREAQAAEAAMEEAQVEQGPDAPVLTGPETGEDGGADRR